MTHKRNVQPSDAASVERAMKLCPFCSESIRAEAIKCKHCQSDLRSGAATQDAVHRGANSGVLGTLMLLVPLGATVLVWIWVGSMNLLQDPSSTLLLLGVLTIAATATLAGVEAQHVGAGRAHDLDRKGRKRSGPIAWAVAILLLWVVCFPAWLYQRSKYGLRSLVAGGVLVTMLFAGSWFGMMTAIESKKSDIRRTLSGLQNDFTSQATPASITTVAEVASANVVTVAAYEMIQNSMSYDEVTAIIGVPGRELSRSKLAGYTTVMYSWSNAGGSGIVAMFQNDRLINKSQFGLR